MPVAQLQAEVIPQFFPSHWLKGASDIVFSEFPSRVRIGYVTRANGAYSYVMREQLDKSRLSLHELHETALENLRRLPSPALNVAVTPGGCEAWLADTQDNFNAARLLLPTLQQQLSAKLGEPFAVVMPCRDWFFCWSTEQADEWQAKNRAEALQIFRDDDYNLTPDVLSFADGMFSLNVAQTPDPNSLVNADPFKRRSASLKRAGCR